jgi:bifunctional UDP-N-acetylglucosamine pyrophosphorylase/glucosamine-1-phosphate N-acetyltransferase
MSERAALVVLVLAAGQGKRMRSDRAKVLHPLEGRPLLQHVLDAVRPLRPDRTLVVVGHQREQVIQALAGSGCEIVMQAEQLGTGHAVMMAAPLLAGFTGTLLVVCGDTPLLATRTLAELLAEHRRSGAAATVLSARVPDPSGYGRIVRGPAGDLERIVEERDASAADRALTEINSGMYAFDYPALLDTLDLLQRDNAQGEYYLTDSIAHLRAAGRRVRAQCAQDYREVLGVNTAEQLQEAAAILAELKNSLGFRQVGA